MTAPKDMQGWKLEDDATGTFVILTHPDGRKMWFIATAYAAALTRRYNDKKTLTDENAFTITADLLRNYGMKPSRVAGPPILDEQGIEWTWK